MALPAKKLDAFRKGGKKKSDHDDEKDHEHDEHEDEHGEHGHQDDEDDDKSGHEVMYDEDDDDHHHGGKKKDKGGEGGGKANLKKAEEDSQDRADDHLEDLLADYDEESGGTPEWVSDEGKWEKAKDVVEPKWDSYDEPYRVVAYVYKQMGGGFKGGGDSGGGDQGDDE